MESTSSEARASGVPATWLALLEFPRALGELGALPLLAPWLTFAPKGDGHGVLVMPGFLADDRSTVILRQFLTRLGYRAEPWQLGRNLGLDRIGGVDSLAARLEDIYTATGAPVSLVGWSLGGVHARRLAKALPQRVRQVITLGSPIGGEPTRTRLSRTWEAANDVVMDQRFVDRFLREHRQPPPVPSTAIYSRSDGIVAWQIATETRGAQTESIEVGGSHLGLGVNAAVLYLIAERLAQAAEDWQPFRAEGWRQALFRPDPR